MSSEYWIIARISDGSGGMNDIMRITNNEDRGDGYDKREEDSGGP